MRRQKPAKVFAVLVCVCGDELPYTAIGETFHVARALLAQEIGVEPGDIRLHPPARLS